MIQAAERSAGFPFKLNKDIFGAHNRDLPATNVVVNKPHKLAYAPIPKNACTALKIMFFELNRGVAFNHGFEVVHTVFDYRAIDFDLFAEDQEYFKFIVVRDPIERFVSAYNNRVKMYGEISQTWFRKNGQDTAKLEEKFARQSLLFDPDINEFATKIDEYVNVSTRIKHHFVPQHFFFQGRLDAFDKVYDIRQLDELIAGIGAKVGHAVSLRNVQETKDLKDAARLSDLTPEALANVKSYYARDYELLAPYLKPKAPKAAAPQPVAAGAENG